MKNNYPIDDEAEALEQALLDLAARKRAILRAERKFQITLYFTCIAIAIGAGFLLGRFTA